MRYNARPFNSRRAKIILSLRSAAQRAGVSPGAPAHHFGSAKGLLTEVALLAFERLGRYIEEVGHSDDVAAYVPALSLAFVAFALDRQSIGRVRPGHLTGLAQDHQS